VGLQYDIELIKAPNHRSPSLQSGKLQNNTQSQPEIELDLEGMMDVTNYAGVDLKEEEFTLNEFATAGGSGSQERYKEVPFLNTTPLEKKLHEIGIS
jgi:hypothetical protein